MTQVSDNLKAKIKALLEKSQKTDSQAEAESFAAKATELLLKYNLSMSQIENLEEKEQLEETNHFILNEIKEHGTYTKGLISCLAFYNFCDVIYWDNDSKFTLIGEKTNLDTVLYLFDYLKSSFPKIGLEKYSNTLKEKRAFYKTTNSYLKEDALEGFVEEFPEFEEDVELKDIMPLSYKEGIESQYQIKNMKKVGLDDRMVFLRSFLLGCVKGLRERLKGERVEQIKQNELESANSTALTIQNMIVIKHKEIKAFEAKKHPRLRTVMSTSERPSSNDAFHSGVKTGKEISLNSQNKSLKFLE